MMTLHDLISALQSAASVVDGNPEVRIIDTEGEEYEVLTVHTGGLHPVYLRIITDREANWS